MMFCCLFCGGVVCILAFQGRYTIVNMLIQVQCGVVFDGFCNHSICIVDIEDDVVSVSPIGIEGELTSLVSVEFARL